MGKLVQAHMPSMRKEFQTYFPDLNALGSNFICSVWRWFSVEMRSLSNGMHEDFCNFLNDSTARDTFEVLVYDE